MVSAGKDQRIYLWTVQGEFVGRVGGVQWRLNDRSSWGKGHDGREAEAAAALALQLSVAKNTEGTQC